MALAFRQVFLCNLYMHCLDFESSFFYLTKNIFPYISIGIINNADICLKIKKSASTDRSILVIK